jgi:hypothetical protein
MSEHRDFLQVMATIVMKQGLMISGQRVVSFAYSKGLYLLGKVYA